MAPTIFPLWSIGRPLTTLCTALDPTSSLLVMSTSTSFTIDVSGQQFLIIGKGTVSTGRKNLLQR
ncbi:hypothetical protein NEOLI_003284 [Neolecta irregularis DAH-3]|uniref:Uncharacterized protein n=1 Tax=Neolecta irregularis (strain DAH-3) TaxID=1198029 RepID=A0A1U7LHP6_NEOID|nr:hypothetical protein NEOLI_003284 [Neolecta irregularis DAH-3]|eukprot:OLL22072.1 hypothetical protein NEOLI_003284 [Neolecta irregularis DAH-3]